MDESFFIADRRKLLYVDCQLFQARIRMEAMIAENKQREATNNAMAYSDADFLALEKEFPVLTHNGFIEYTVH